MTARNFIDTVHAQVLCGFTYILYLREDLVRIFKRLRGPGIDSKESIPAAYVAWRAGAIIQFLLGS
jgi:hypothetical protein